MSDNQDAVHDQVKDTNAQTNDELSTTEIIWYFVLLFMASISIGVGTESFGIGFGVFCALLYLGSAPDVAIRRHSGLLKSYLGSKR
jgi:uncharacterized membrane protein YfcA